MCVISDDKVILISKLQRSTVTVKKKLIETFGGVRMLGLIGKGYR